MAVSKLGTFMGHPVKHYNGYSNPQVGDMVIDHQTLTTKIYTGTEWYELASEDLSPNLTDIELRWQNRREINDEYLEETYPDLKKLKEEYTEMRDKYKVFEILKVDNDGT